MSQSYDFYKERADAAAAAADNAQLANVRERELRAEKTWRGLAEQARAVTHQRAKVEKEKADAREQARVEAAAEAEAAAESKADAAASED